MVFALDAKTKRKILGTNIEAKMSKVSAFDVDWEAESKRQIELLEHKIKRELTTEEKRLFGIGFSCGMLTMQETLNPLGDAKRRWLH